MHDLVVGKSSTHASSSDYQLTASFRLTTASSSINNHLPISTNFNTLPVADTLVRAGPLLGLPPHRPPPPHHGLPGAGLLQRQRAPPYGSAERAVPQPWAAAPRERGAQAAAAVAGAWGSMEGGCNGSDGCEGGVEENVCVHGSCVWCVGSMWKVAAGGTGLLQSPGAWRGMEGALCARTWQRISG